jgi:hypothetical protein
MFDCPVKADFEHALQSAKAFGKAMRKLRRSMARCSKCSMLDDCPLRREIDQAIQTAVTEITSEWELSVDDR